MYIRRKVFSIALDENGEERLFSTNEVVTKEKKDLPKGKKAAIATGALAGVGAAGIAGAKKIGAKKQQLGEAINLLNRDVKGMTSKELARLEEIQTNPKLAEKALKVAGKMKNVSKDAGKMLRQGKSLQKPADKIMKGVRKVFKK
jgi:hypothetical protein